MSLYLDYSASTPVDYRVLEIMIDVYKNSYGNAHSRPHIHGKRAGEVVLNSRKQIATLLGLDPSEVFFTSGATESNNIAILGLARWGVKNQKTHIISTALEHKAVLEPLNYLQENGFEVDFVSPDSSGRVKAEEIINRISKRTLMISVMHVNNETGIIQPVVEIGKTLKNMDVYFHIDAAQSYGKLVIELQEIPYDILSISGHKTGGPQGIGALILKRKKHKLPPLEPVMYGGDQEGGIRPGTLPVALIAGLGKASELAGSEYQERNKLTTQMKNSFLEAIRSLTCQINGDPQYCLPNLINISFTGVDSDALLLSLKNELSFSNGSACTSHDYSPSHVLTAMGLNEERIGSAVRISWSGQEKVNWLPLTQKVRNFTS